MLAALATRRALLERFEIGPLWERGIEGLWFINAETPPLELEAEALRLLGPFEDWEEEVVQIVHLEQLGGAQMFDLTDPNIYTMWRLRMTHCSACNGTDDRPPAVVIVDGVTAILLAAGKGVEHVGLWFAAFRRLMREIGTPNALAIGHNTLTGSHLMGGVPAMAGSDGLWNYSSDDVDDPFSARRFSVVPRLGGIPVAPIKVNRGEDGRLMAGSVAEAAAEKGATDREIILAVAHRTKDYVLLHPGVDGQALTDNVESTTKGINLAGRAKAVELELIREVACGKHCQICQRPHPRRSHYWPPPPRPLLSADV